MIFNGRRGYSRSRYKPMSSLARSSLLTALLALASQPVIAAEAKTVRLLTIGNSFSANATHYLPDLAKAGGHGLIHKGIVVGGASLELHAGKAAKHEKDPKDKAGLYSNGRSLKQELAAQPWDFVTIQQASIKSHDSATYEPFASQLVALIKTAAPTAKLLVHQTWAYRSDDVRFTKPTGKAGEPTTQDAMHQKLTLAYESIATKLGARLLPVGNAFQLANTDPAWGYKPDTSFDPQKAQPPMLPDQTHSLNLGWQWKVGKTGKQTLGMDGHHANMAGEYLGACVWYEVLFGGSVVGNSFSPKGLSAADTRYLQETAHRAVLATQNH